jgi:RNA polymerase sigma-B factor
LTTPTKTKPRSTTSAATESVEIGPIPRDLAELSDEDLFRMMPKAQPADRDRIREALVTRHGGLVRWLAAQYAYQAVDVEELRQVGYLGLVLAVDRFDVDRGSDFISFARPTVQGEIRRWFRDKRRWVRLPRRLQEAKAVLRNSTEELTHKLNRAPTLSELAAHCGLPESLVAEAEAADDNFTTASLDAPVGHDGDESFSLADMVGTEDPLMDLLVDCNALRPLLAELDERDRRLLELRFYHDFTQVEIGKELGCSQMHVSRLLNRVLTQLRNALLEEPSVVAA